MAFCVINSPAKKMNVVEGPPWAAAQPVFLDRTRQLAEVLQGLGYGELKALWKCSDALATLNYQRLRDLDLDCEGTAAVLSYEGIQYQHLAAQVMSEDQLDWLQAHLRILSGFYGVLRPLDGVVPYRLEMQARLAVAGARDLYGFWGASLYDQLAQDFDLIVNVASKEYAAAVEPHVRPDGPQVLTCLFGTLEQKGGQTRLVQRATEAKAARGTFIRWCAENDVQDPAQLARFCERGYQLDRSRSSQKTLVFARS